MLDIGKEQRYDLFDLRIRFPEPLVPRTLRREIRRAGAAIDGSARRPRRRGVAPRGCRTRRRAQDRGTRRRPLAFATPIRHTSIRSAARCAGISRAPTVSSSDVCPFMREYERWTTTSVNAYTQPMVDRYLAAPRERARRARLWRQVLRHDSSGGVATPADRPALSRAPDRIGPRGGRADVGAHLSRHLDRSPARTVVRHGRHHRQGLR